MATTPLSIRHFFSQFIKPSLRRIRLNARGKFAQRTRYSQFLRSIRRGNDNPDPAMLAAVESGEHPESTAFP
jgi:hypothetical protein